MTKWKCDVRNHSIWQWHYLPLDCEYVSSPSMARIPFVSRYPGDVACSCYSDRTATLAFKCKSTKTCASFVCNYNTIRSNSEDWQWLCLVSEMRATVIPNRTWHFGSVLTVVEHPQSAVYTFLLCDWHSARRAETSGQRKDRCCRRLIRSLRSLFNHCRWHYPSGVHLTSSRSKRLWRSGIVLRTTRVNMRRRLDPGRVIR